jgi:hypothetical protein
MLGQDVAEDSSQLAAELNHYFRQTRATRTPPWTRGVNGNVVPPPPSSSLGRLSRMPDSGGLRTGGLGQGPAARLPVQSTPYGGSLRSFAVPPEPNSWLPPTAGF